MLKKAIPINIATTTNIIKNFLFITIFLIFDVALFHKFDIEDNMQDIYYVLTKEGRKRYLTNIKIYAFIILNNHVSQEL